MQKGKESYGSSGTLATRDPAWGAKKVGEKPSFSPRARGGVTYRSDGYFAEGQNNTPPMPEIPFRISGSLCRSKGSGS